MATKTSGAPAVFSGNVHPVAAMFPLMSDEELDDLAEDITANGLLHPVILDAEGTLIDGRNRLEACRRAEVEPTFGMLNGHEPVAFILSANVSRRHLSKGQQAMAVARGCLETKRPIRQAASDARVNIGRVSQANTVLKFAPDQTEGVMAGSTGLDEAYEEARRRKEAAESDETRFAVLQRDAPDLAVMVQEERLTLKEAVNALMARREEDAQRDRERAEDLRQTSRNLLSVLTYLDPLNIDTDESAARWLDADPRLVSGDHDFSAERMRRCAEVLNRAAEMKESNGNA
jgi:hypothetical protein